MSLHLKGVTEITPESAGWTYTGLKIVTLTDPVTVATGADEWAIVPLAGHGQVEAEDQTLTLNGRASVFDGPSDFAYVPKDSEFRLTGEGRFALAHAPARQRLEVAYGPAEQVPVEIRGAGNCTRQLNNFLGPGEFPADRLVCVEVLTPEGNWSSYPPHKHDDASDGTEAELEEIYYFEVKGANGYGIHRTYTADREIDETVIVESGDAFLVPRGYHGPCIAAPGHDLYYLNVLAGPGEPSLAFSDDPAHHWLREAWADMDTDPRLPMTPERTPR